MVSKFAARDNESLVDLTSGADDEAESVADISLDEVCFCVSDMKNGKATGPDGVPIEQYKFSENATIALHDVLRSIWNDEVCQDYFVLADIYYDARNCQIYKQGFGRPEVAATTY